MRGLTLSIVIPVYNEEESIPYLVEWIKKVIQEHNISTEIILVDDGSTDHSWEKIKEMTNKYATIGYRLKKNQGKSAALQTGFNKAQGDYVITMDADLQDNPDEIPSLLKLIQDKNFDLVSGWKQKRRDPLSKRIPSKLFNLVTRWVSGIALNDFNCGLKIYKKEVIKNIHVYGEMHRYIPLIAKWNGFNEIGEKVVIHKPRKYGVSKYGMKRFFTGFLDLLSVVMVYRFKKNPMHFFGVIGIVSFFIGFFIAIGLIFEKLYHQFYKLPIRDVVDQPLFFLALIALVIGVQLFMTGFIAEMLVQINVKNEYLIYESSERQKED